MARISRLVGAALFQFAALALPAGAQTVQDLGASAAQAMDSMRAVVIARSSSSTEANVLDGLDVGFLPHAATTTLSLGIGVHAPEQYTVTGRCDADCRDLDIFVHNETNNMVGMDGAADATPTVTFIAQPGHTYTVDVRMQNCTSTLRICYFALGTFSQFPADGDASK